MSTAKSRSVHSTEPPSSSRDVPSRGVLAVALGALLLSSGCDGLFGPSGDDGLPLELELEMVPLALDSLWIQQLRVESEGAGGTAWIQAFGPETWDPARAHLRGRAVVTGTSGDSEEILIGHNLCKGEGEVYWSCFRFILLVDSPDDIPDLKERVMALPARWGLPGICNGLGECELLPIADERMQVWIYANDLGRAMREVARWPGVQGVELSLIGEVWGDPPNDPTRYQGGLPVDVGPPQPDNGILEVSSGDTVTVEYVHPDGTVLRASEEIVF